MNEPSFSLYRAQVTGVSPSTGEIAVAFYLGGNSLQLPHVKVAGNAGQGIDWLPNVGDYLLLGYEPGQNPVIVAVYLDPTLAAKVSPPLVAGEVRLGSTVTGPGGKTIPGVDPAIVGSPPSAATAALRITLDGGVTWHRIALSPDS